MNSVEWPCSPWVLVDQWIKCPPCIREVMGLIPVGDSDFFFVHARVMLINSPFTAHSLLNCEVYHMRHWNRATTRSNNYLTSWSLSHFCLMEILSCSLTTVENELQFSKGVDTTQMKHNINCSKSTVKQ